MLLYGYGKVGANVVTLMATNAVILPDRLAFDLWIQLKHLFGTNPYAKAATLTPFLVDGNVELFRQKIHLPPHSMDNAVISPLHPPRRTCYRRHMIVV